MSVETHPEAGPRPGGYAELAAEIRRLGLMDRRPVFYTGLPTAILVALTAWVTGLLLLRGSWWALLLAPVLGLLSAQLGFYGHDATHRQISRRERPSRLLAMAVANLHNGLSYGWWLDKHNAHHAHPNDLESRSSRRTSRWPGTSTRSVRNSVSRHRGSSGSPACEVTR